MFDEIASPNPSKTPRPQTSAVDPNAQPIQVFLRVRPINTYSTVELISDTIIRTTPPANSQLYKLAHVNTNITKDFTFTKILGPDHDQNMTFNTTTSHLIEGFFNNMNGLLFAYGVTNAGKTFTMVGTDSAPGILPRSLEVYFLIVIINHNDVTSVYSIDLMLQEKMLN